VVLASLLVVTNEAGFRQVYRQRGGLGMVAHGGEASYKCGVLHLSRPVTVGTLSHVGFCSLGCNTENQSSVKFCTMPGTAVHAGAMSTPSRLTRGGQARAVCDGAPLRCRTFFGGRASFGAAPASRRRWVMGAS